MVDIFLRHVDRYRSITVHLPSRKTLSAVFPLPGALKHLRKLRVEYSGSADFRLFDALSECRLTSLMLRCPPPQDLGTIECEDIVHCVFPDSHRGSEQFARHLLRCKSLTFLQWTAPREYVHFTPGFGIDFPHLKSLILSTPFPLPPKRVSAPLLQHLHIPILGTMRQ